MRFTKVRWFLKIFFASQNLFSFTFYSFPYVAATFWLNFIAVLCTLLIFTFLCTIEPVFRLMIFWIFQFAVLLLRHRIHRAHSRIPPPHPAAPHGNRLLHPHHAAALLDLPRGLWPAPVSTLLRHALRQFLRPGGQCRHQAQLRQSWARSSRHRHPQFPGHGVSRRFLPPGLHKLNAHQRRTAQSIQI